MRVLLLLGIACGPGACTHARTAPSEGSVPMRAGNGGEENRVPPGVLVPSSTAGSLAVPGGAPGTATVPPTLKRPDIHSAVAQGLGVFLQHIDLDDRPVRVGGKFHGFRILALRDGAFWKGVDLKPGDVVTSINGFPIERPEQAQTAFDSLEVASELRVAYERDGQARELVFSIVDER